ncbi:response regulator [uncultured Salinisphaera sp.]|uniref:response regulator n=1 Tax=uncultured Salinisphaera sp. TaxID=359372 RepID=UPI0032B1312B|tara:strand:+ start:3186 stop:3854 length:669 start_codon:yes stop_codon:yes gene_type:complete
MRLLLIEDDALIAESVTASLTGAGHTVDALTSAAEAHGALARERFNLILLDLGLPDGDGLDVLAALRDSGDATPVLILTARDNVDDRVRGLDRGADDYLAKPFSLAELKARVRALGRRSQQRTDDRLVLGPLVFDAATATLTLHDEVLDLPRRELRLAENLLRHGQQIVARETLDAQLFGFDAVGSNALEVYISRLRKRLAGSGLAIRTLRGLGYRLEIERS